MPFWWGRRRKFWWGRRGRYQRRKYYKTRRQRRRRQFTRRRFRKPTKRRRRRRKKVRRKKAALKLVQWQPDSINKCKIKGLGLLVMGSEGRQFSCYTVVKNKYWPPKVPSGGGFGCEKYTLSYAYEEYKFGNNIWTKSNISKDLCRYLLAKLVFFRAPETDFIVSYTRQPPFDLNILTYPGCHPHQLLQSKHKKIIYSKFTKPNGKYKYKMIIKPPKQMINKWFFTSDFCKQGLFLLKGAALNLNYSYLGCCNSNQLANVLSLNINFYHHAAWAQVLTESPYKPYSTAPDPIWAKYPNSTEKKQITGMNTDYSSSVNLKTGWFRPEILQASQLFQTATAATATRAVGAARYNPNKDAGRGNKVYLTSIFADTYKPPTTDKMLVIEDLPIWLALYGFTDYVRTVKTSDFLRQSLLIIQTDYMHCEPEIQSCKTFIPLDLYFIQGKSYRGLTPTDYEVRNWYPSLERQLDAINALVETGPYIPKLAETRNSTWELKYTYSLFFKWGGPQIHDEPVHDPCTFPTYPVPDKDSKTIQIKDPAKQKTESLLHKWDVRRGIIKEKAIKRMFSNISTDTEFQPITEDAPLQKKKRKGARLTDPQEEIKEIQACLQSLCEESTYQEIQETQDLRHLIKQQQQQQDQLKYNILKLLSELKEKQQQLQLQTGMFL
nr:MAG: ORF1 [Torque teno midi virus]